MAGNGTQLVGAFISKTSRWWCILVGTVEQVVNDIVYDQRSENANDSVRVRQKADDDVMQLTNDKDDP